MSQSVVSVRVDSEDKKAFDSFCTSIGLSTSGAINMFIKKVINENRIPFEVSLPRKKVTLEEGRKAFEALREEARKNGIQGMSLEEINAEIDAVRRGEK